MVETFYVSSSRRFFSLLSFLFTSLSQTENVYSSQCHLEKKCCLACVLVSFLLSIFSSFISLSLSLISLKKISFFGVSQSLSIVGLKLETV